MLLELTNVSDPDIKESVSVSIPHASFSTFTKRFVLSKILEAQEKGVLKQNWIDKRMELAIPMMALGDYDQQIYDLKVSLDIGVAMESGSIDIRVIPESGKEFKCFLT